MNIVNREFKRGARKVLLTDITYLFFADRDVCYLTTILDAFTHEVLSYSVSKNLKVDFVLETVDRLLAECGSTLDDEVIVHNDQGCQYTSYAFIQKLKDAEFVQSMSRRGNCWDNSPQESFFGHMKDEVAERVAACKTYQEVLAQVDDWIDYYNSDRGQWDLLKLTHREYYDYLLTGIFRVQSQPFPVLCPGPRGLMLCARRAALKKSGTSAPPSVTRIGALVAP